MAVPVFVGAGTGGGVATGTLSINKASCTAGNIILVHAMVRGLSEDWGGGSQTNISNLAGTANAIDNIVTQAGVGAPTSFMWFDIGRCTTDGTCTWNINVGVSSQDIFGRVYEFSGCALGTTVASVVENVGGGGGGTWGVGSGTGTTVSDAGVVTGSSDRLALQFVGLDANLTIGDMTGETGGDWTEAVAEFGSAVGSTATLQLQTAAMATAGTINGGTVTITSAGWGCMGTALIPAPPPRQVPQVFPPQKFGPF